MNIHLFAVQNVNFPLIFGQEKSRMSNLYFSPLHCAGIRWETHWWTWLLRCRGWSWGNYFLSILLSTHLYFMIMSIIYSFADFWAKYSQLSKWGHNFLDYNLLLMICKLGQIFPLFPKHNVERLPRTFNNFDQTFHGNPWGQKPFKEVMEFTPMDAQKFDFPHFGKG